MSDDDRGISGEEIVVSVIGVMLVGLWFLWLDWWLGG